MKKLNSLNQVKKYLDLYFALKREMSGETWEKLCRPYIAEKYPDVIKYIEGFISSVEKNAGTFISQNIDAEDAFKTGYYRLTKSQLDELSSLLVDVAEDKFVKNIADQTRDIFGDTATSYVSFLTAIKNEAVVAELSARLEKEMQGNGTTVNINNIMNIVENIDEVNARISNKITYGNGRLNGLRDMIGKVPKGTSIYSILTQMEKSADEVNKEVAKLYAGISRIIGIDISNGRANKKRHEEVMMAIRRLESKSSGTMLMNYLNAFSVKMNENFANAVRAIESQIEGLGDQMLDSEDRIKKHTTDEANRVLKAMDETKAGIVAGVVVMAALGVSFVLNCVQAGINNNLKKENTQLKAQIDELLNNAKEADYIALFDKLDTTLSLLSNAVADNSITDAEKKEIEAQISEFTQIKNQVVKGYADKFGKDIGVVMNSYIGLQVQISNLQGDINDLNNSISDLGVQIQTLNSTVDTLNQKIVDLEAQIAQVPGNVNNLQAQLDKAKADLATAEARIATLETEKANLETENATLKDERDTAVNDYQTLLSDYNQLVADYANLQATYDALIAGGVASQAELDQVKVDLAQTKAELANEIQANKNNKQFVTGMYSNLFGSSVSGKTNEQMIAEIADVLGLNITVDISGLEADESGRTK